MPPPSGSTFSGRLIRLRAREPEDEPLLYQWFNDPEVVEYLTVRYPISHATERSFLDSHRQPSFAEADFAVVTLEDGTCIGGAGISVPYPESRAGILGIGIGDKRYWDRGYGTDTMRVLCRVGFDTMNLHRIELEVFVGNERARKVYQRVGFVEEGRKRDAIYKDGRYDDIIVMGLLRGELRWN